MHRQTNKQTDRDMDIDTWAQRATLTDTLVHIQLDIPLEDIGSLSYKA